MLLRKFRENPTLNENIKERNLVLDPDLIDLTMIPPPMTPDEVMIINTVRTKKLLTECRLCSSFYKMSPKIF